MSDYKKEPCPACGTECYVIQTELEGTAYLDPVEDKRIQELKTALLDCLEYERPCSDTMDKYRAIAEK